MGPFEFQSLPVVRNKGLMQRIPHGTQISILKKNRHVGRPLRSAAQHFKKSTLPHVHQISLTDPA